MGDTGALMIGFLLSVMSIRICDILDAVLNVNPAVIAFAPLLIPCCDVVRLCIRRIKAYRNPFLPAKIHIHHKLFSLGMTPRIAMSAIVLTGLVLILANYFLSEYIDITILMCLDLALWIFTDIALSRGVLCHSRSIGELIYQK